MAASRRVGLALGGAIAAVLVGAALLSLVWTPYPIDTVAVMDRLQGPSGAHPLGTDQLGRDILSLLLAGARTSILVAIVAVLIGVGVGVPLGLVAATQGGPVDEAVMRLSDLAFAFPALLTAVMITAVFGPSALNAILAIGIFNVPVFARLSRGAALPLVGRDFVLAARIAGKGGARIAVEHVLPNVAPVLIVQATIQFALAILAEAGLAYLGLGAQPPEASWGRMLSEAQTYMSLAPHVIVFPGLTIVVAVLGFNLLGDGLRDRLDPRLHGLR